jgi:anthranilate synthase component 1
MSINVTEPSISCEQLIEITQSTTYNLIPIYIQYQGDLETPVSVFLKIKNHGKNAYNFLLESIEGGEYQSRYSFIGTEPYQIIQQCKQKKMKFYLIF